MPGEIGAGPGTYTAVGHPVGMAQRMEAAADPGGVMCTASTARLHSSVLGPTEWVTVKGAGEPVPARRLERVESDRTVMGRDEGPLMGRDADLGELLDAFNGGQICVVSVVGEPGLGKSRLIRELAAGATTTGAEIVIARCESHTAIEVTRHGCKALGHTAFRRLAPHPRQRGGRAPARAAQGWPALIPEQSRREIRRHRLR